MHAVDADDAHEDEPDVSDEEAGVLDGVGHGQDAGADVALQQVDYGVYVAATRENIIYEFMTIRHAVTTFYCTTQAYFTNVRSVTHDMGG